MRDSRLPDLVAGAAALLLTGLLAGAQARSLTPWDVAEWFSGSPAEASVPGAVEEAGTPEAQP
jgi:hypothetical protein